MGKVYFINGQAESGKDTFLYRVSEKIEKKGIEIYNYSTVDDIKKFLSYLGIDISKKDTRLRNLMSDMKDLLTAYDDIPNKMAASFINFHLRDKNNSSDIVFVHCRESENIKNIEKMISDIVKPEDIKSILLKRSGHNVSECEKDSPESVEKHKYDIIFTHDCMEDLESNVNSFIQIENL
jgi:hypothetical protein